MKRVVVRIHHSTHPPFKLILCPNTKVSDVLAYLNLPDDDYVLCPLDDPNKQYTSTEVFYDLIESDAKLIARISPEAAERELRKRIAEADAFMERIAFGEGEI